MSPAVPSTRPYRRQAVLCRALSHPARLAILDALRGGEQCVCHLEAALGLRQAYISQQLMVLRETGLVSDRREGWNIYYRLRDAGTSRLIGVLNSEAGVRASHKGASRSPKDCPCPKCTSGGKK